MGLIGFGVYRAHGAGSEFRDVVFSFRKLWFRVQGPGFAGSRMLGCLCDGLGSSIRRMEMHLDFNWS